MPRRRSPPPTPRSAWLLLHPPTIPRRETSRRSAAALVTVPVTVLVAGRAGGLVEDGPDPLGPVGVAGLRAPAGWLVVPAAGHLVRRVLLGHDALVHVVRVLVILAVTEARGPGVVRVAQVRGHRAGQAGPDVLPGGADGPDSRVGFGREGQVDGGLGQVDPRLGQADELDRLRGRDRDTERRRVRHPDV